MLLLTALLACAPDAETLTGLPNAPGGDPLVPEHALLPFPSDFFLEGDADTPTGRRIALPDEALPEPLLPETFAHMDGFTRVPAMLAWLPGGFDAASLPDPLALDATLSPDSPVLVLREGDWTPVPVLAELDLNARSAREQALILRPHRALEPDTGYVVLLRDSLRRADGSAHVAGDAFRALRDGIPTDSSDVERWRGDFELVNDAIAGAGLDPAEVVLGWSFHTRSEEQVVTPALTMHDAAASFPLDGWELVSDTRDDGNRLVEGTFRAPDFVGPDGTLVTDAHGVPTVQGERDVPFLVTIPDVVDETRPTIAFGHGFFSAKEETTWGSLQNSLERWRMSTISVDFEGFDESHQFETFGILGGDLNRTHEIVAQQLQSQMHFTLAARLVREHLSQDLEVDRGDGAFRPLDPDAVPYLGISNGGTQGFTLLTASPAFDRGVLVVPGGAMSHMLERAVQWNTMGMVFRNQFEDPIALQVVVTLFQHVLDPMDGVNFVEHLAHDRYEGRGPLSVTLHEAVGDTQVSNMITEWMARTGDIPVITPSTRDVWGVSTLSAPDPAGADDANAALFVYDEGYDPLPTGNLPPNEENGAHESIRYLEAYLEQVQRFLEDGTIVQVCDGACDPD